MIVAGAAIENSWHVYRRQNHDHIVAALCEHVDGRSAKGSHPVAVHQNAHLVVDPREHINRIAAVGAADEQVFLVGIHIVGLERDGNDIHIVCGHGADVAFRVLRRGLDVIGAAVGINVGQRLCAVVGRGGYGLRVTIAPINGVCKSGRNVGRIRICRVDREG